MPLPLTVSCSSKIQTGFTFLVPAHPGSRGQGAVKRVCVCVSWRKKVTGGRGWLRYASARVFVCRSCTRDRQPAGSRRALRPRQLRSISCTRPAGCWPWSSSPEGSQQNRDLLQPPAGRARRRRGRVDKVCRTAYRRNYHPMGPVRGTRPSSIGELAGTSLRQVYLVPSNWLLLFRWARHLITVKGKVFPHSLPSVGPGADTGV